MKPRALVAILAVGALSVPSALPQDSSAHIARLETDKLRAVIADNEAFGDTHRAGYNGVAELRHTNDSRNLFVPQYAGLNLEHIFSGDAQSFGWNIFEPRRAPMQLIRRSPTPAGKSGD